MTETFDCIVVGAGVIGLAAARRLAIAGQHVLILESAAAHGSGVSSRSSEVIHAGLYYTPDSLKARLCVAGRRALYDYCATRGIPFRTCGKLVVATEVSEESALARVAQRADANGVENLLWLGAADARALEPELHCTAALHSPVTGIIDSTAYMFALLGEAEGSRALLACHAPVDKITCAGAQFAIHVGGGSPVTVYAHRVVNAAGLGAVTLAHRIDAMPPDQIPRAYISKGNYFALTGRQPFRHLIYPVPIPGGAGIHLTLDMAGQARFGPDVEQITAPSYHANPDRLPAFYSAIRRYWPTLPDGALAPAYAGIRPKIVPPHAMADFVIQGEADHGVPGLINLFGIESPGLTSSLAIAEHIASILL